MKEKVTMFLSTLDEDKTYKKRELFLGGLVIGMAGMLVGFMTGALIGKGIKWSMTLLSNNGSDNGCNNTDNKAALTVNTKKKADKHKHK